MEYEPNQRIAFYCGGRGRGGHVTAFCEVAKINKKTVILTEMSNSYMPGQSWRVPKDWLAENLVSRGMCPSGYNGY